MTVRTKFGPNSDSLEFWVGVAKHNLQEEKVVRVGDGTSVALPIPEIIGGNFEIIFEEFQPM